MFATFVARNLGGPERGIPAICSTPVMRTRGLAVLLVAILMSLIATTPAFAGASNFTCRFGSLRIAADVHAGAGLLLSGSHAAERLRVPSYRSGGAGFTAVANRTRWDVRIPGNSFVSSSRAELVYRRRDGRPTRFHGVCRRIFGDRVLGILRSGRAVVRSGPHADAAPLAVKADDRPFIWAPTRYGSDAATSGEWIHVEIDPIGGASSEGWVARGDAGFLESSITDGTSLLPALAGS